MAQKILGNSGWLVADKILRMGVALFVTVWIARYLGPQDFGSLNYALAFVGIFAAFAGMGLQGIVIRDLVRRPDERRGLLASALVLRLIGAFMAITMAILAIVLLRPGDGQAWGLVVIFSSALLPAAFDVIDYRYQADLNSKPVVLIRAMVFILFSVVKVAIILIKGTVLMFAAASSAETAVVAITLLLYANSQGTSFKLGDATWRECRRLMKESWPLLFAGISIAIYMRIDQVMLGEMLGDDAVGVFSAAVRVSEIWYFVPVSIMASAAPALTTLHQQSSEAYEKRLLSAMRLLVGIAVLVALTLTFFAARTVALLYGPQYAEAASVLVIHTWGGVFVCLGVAAGYWLINAGLAKYSLYQSMAGAMINAAMNLALIPILGLKGAAFATLVGYGVSAVFFNAIRRETRPLFKMQMRAMSWIR